MSRRARLTCITLGVALVAPAFWLRIHGGRPADLPVFRPARR